MKRFLRDELAETYGREFSLVINTQMIEDEDELDDNEKQMKDESYYSKQTQQRKKKLSKKEVEIKIV